MTEFLAAKPLLDAGETDLRTYLAAIHSRGVRSAAARRTVVVLRRYFGWLCRERLRLDNPALNLELPKLPAPYPKALGVARMNRLLESPRQTVPLREQLRDRAMLEVAYGSGLRVSELLELKSIHLDLNEGTLKVMGKGSKERLVPLGEPAIDAIGAYLKEGRPAYLKPHTATEYLFLTRLGTRMSPSGFWRHLQTLARTAGVEASLVSPHVLRHSFATDLMMGGANLRVIQELLGHASIGTTAVYLRQDDNHLRELVRKHHPRG